MSFSDTIYAVSTPPGRGGIAVVRVSGSMAQMSLLALILGGQRLPKPRQASLRTLFYKNKMIDQALVVVFAAPKSFTGEYTVEYHVHGGWSVVQTLLQALSEQDNHRMARPGEFTRRAFENGKLDLTEAEAVADLIDAETEQQRLQALSQLSGTLKKIYERWTVRLSHILALMEADLDFSDQDLPEDILLQVRPDISDLTADIADHLNDNRRGERLRNGFQVSILGAPNAGKSSLLNALAQRDVAIVSPIAGTTRDIVETHLDLGGFAVILSDTAGLRQILSEDDQSQIESQGIERALNLAQNSDLKIIVFDATQERDSKTEALIDPASLVVYTKSDLQTPPDGSLGVSSINGKGLDNLLQQIVSSLSSQIGTKTTPTLTRQRHRQALEQAKEALERSEIASQPELAAEDLRLALRYLGSITGHVDVEDLLDMIFRDFCIGK